VSVILPDFRMKDKRYKDIRIKHLLTHSSGLKYGIYGEEFEHNPSGNLISSAVELNFWMQYNLSIYTDSTFNSILTQSTLKEMWVTQKEIPDKKTSIGWGWWIHQDEKLGKSVFHVGTNTGFCSILMIYPEKVY
jgi:CubicO group peptidase (beta-lactamase class C family)